MPTTGRQLTRLRTSPYAPYRLQRNNVFDLVPRPKRALAASSCIVLEMLEIQDNATKPNPIPVALLLIR
uniref:Uncharacterized protein n=1 Tax=Talaromyces marneffei PM1 TaxID=1077442 RepID=A0A093V0D7_TALMA